MFMRLLAILGFVTMRCQVVPQRTRHGSCYWTEMLGWLRTRHGSDPQGDKVFEGLLIFTEQYRVDVRKCFQHWLFAMLQSQGADAGVHHNTLPGIPNMMRSRT